MIRASAAAWTSSGTPALSRPRRSTSSGAKAKSQWATSALVVSEHEPPPPAAGHASKPASRRGGRSPHGRDSPCRRGGGAVGQVEAGRLDDVDRDAEAGGEPQHRAGVLRDVGLVEGERDGIAADSGRALSSSLLDDAGGCAMVRIVATGPRQVTHARLVRTPESIPSRDDAGRAARRTGCFAFYRLFPRAGAGLLVAIVLVSLLSARHRDGALRLPRLDRRLGDRDAAGRVLRRPRLGAGRHGASSSWSLRPVMALLHARLQPAGAACRA